MELKDIANVACTNIKVYANGESVYSPFSGELTPFLDKEAIWLDAEDDVLVVGIEGGEKHEKE